MRWAVIARRYFIAIRDGMLAPKKSYAQYGEDMQIENLMADLDLDSGIYIDVGANHPTLNSNTYLFYRKNLRGVLVEPDSSNYQLLHRFRKKDISVRTLIGSNMQLNQFNHAFNSALSSVMSLPAAHIQKQEYIPQITLDELTRCIDPKWIFFLSIDAEGADLQILHGAIETLKRTYLLCVECPDDGQAELDIFMHQNKFTEVGLTNSNKIYCNTIFKCPKKQGMNCSES